MMFKFELLPEAEQDLEDIAFFRYEYDLIASLRFVDGVSHRFKKTLSVFPNSGAIYKKEKNIRKITFDDLTAFYTFSEEKETVYIMRIINQTKPLEARGIEF